MNIAEQPVSFRAMGIESVSLLAGLHAEAFPPEEAWEEEAFRSLLSCAGTRALVVSVGGIPAGFILIRTILDEAEILTLATRPQFRRRGLARALIHDILPESQVFLEVSVSNSGAKKLYESCGFHQVGMRRGYYPDGSDAVVMASRI